MTAHGGPQPQSSIEFTIESEDIATISHSGLVDAKEVGVTRVIGRAVGYEGDSGRVIVYSQVMYWQISCPVAVKLMKYSFKYLLALAVYGTDFSSYQGFADSA